MSTEAMLNSFRSWWQSSKYCQVVVPKDGWEQIALDGFNQGVQAATANQEAEIEALKSDLESYMTIANNLANEQEALIKAALDAAAEKCETSAKAACKAGEFTEGSNFERAAEAIRQITPQQVMEKMK